MHQLLALTLHFLSMHFRAHWFESFFEGLWHLIHACIKPLLGLSIVKELLEAIYHIRICHWLTLFQMCLGAEKRSRKWQFWQYSYQREENVPTGAKRICSLCYSMFFPEAQLQTSPPHPAPCNQVLWSLTLTNMEGSFEEKYKLHIQLNIRSGKGPRQVRHP